MPAGISWNVFVKTKKQRLSYVSLGLGPHELPFTNLCVLFVIQLLREVVPSLTTETLD